MLMYPLWKQDSETAKKKGTGGKGKTEEKE